MPLSSTSSARKKSKSQKLEEARARAKAAMANDKKNVLLKGIQKQNASDGGFVDARPVLSRQRKIEAARARAAAAMTPDRMKVQAKQTEHDSKTGPTTPSLKERREAARARAAAAMARDRENIQSVINVSDDDDECSGDESDIALLSTPKPVKRSKANPVSSGKSSSKKDVRSPNLVTSNTPISKSIRNPAPRMSTTPVSRTPPRAASVAPPARVTRATKPLEPAATAMTQDRETVRDRINVSDFDDETSGDESDSTLVSTTIPTTRRKASSSKSSNKNSIRSPTPRMNATPVSSTIRSPTPRMSTVPFPRTPPRAPSTAPRARVTREAMRLPSPPAAKTTSKKKKNPRQQLDPPAVASYTPVSNKEPQAGSFRGASGRRPSAALSDFSDPSPEPFIPADPLRPIEVPESDDEYSLLTYDTALSQNQRTLYQSPLRRTNELTQNEDIIDDRSGLLDDYEDDATADFTKNSDKPLPSRRWNLPSLPWRIISIVMLAVWILNTDFDQDSSPASAAPCFNDFPLPKFESEEEQIDYDQDVCHGRGAPCPENGVCKNGDLVTCHGIHYDLAPDGTHCTLSERAVSSLALMRELLGNWTIRFRCSGGGLTEGIKPFYEGKSEVPMFEYRKMMRLHPVELMVSPFDNKILLEEFHVGEIDNAVVVGLKDEHASQLEYPVGCRIGFSIRSLLRTSECFFTSFVMAVASLFLIFFQDYPLLAVGILVVLWIVRIRRKNQARRAKIMADVAEILQMTFKELRSEPIRPHVALNVRDKLIELSGIDRTYMRTQLWPRVITEILHDNRVRNSKHIVDGFPRYVWTWIALADKVIEE